MNRGDHGIYITMETNFGHWTAQHEGVYFQGGIKPLITDDSLSNVLDYSIATQKDTHNSCKNGS